MLGSGPKGRDVALALSVGADAIDTDRIDIALEALAWAKHEAPRVPAVREAHGVARYLDEDFASALTELQAYRRMTGRSDHNHLIADCLRGLGREMERIAEPIEAMLEDASTPEDRQDEGVIVWAAALADDGQVPAARAVLRRRLQHRPASRSEAVLASRLRVLILAADLAERDDDPDASRRYRAQIAAADPELRQEVVPDDDHEPRGDPQDPTGIEPPHP